MTTTTNTQIENEIITKIHTALTAAGFDLFKVNDGEETQNCSSLVDAISTVHAVDDIVTFYYRHPATETKGEQRGAIQYIAGNGCDVAHDWSGILDAIVTPIILEG